jgi:hypothetical protein
MKLEIGDFSYDGKRLSMSMDLVSAFTGELCVEERRNILRAISLNEEFLKELVEYIRNGSTKDGDWWEDTSEIRRMLYEDLPKWIQADLDEANATIKALREETYEMHELRMDIQDLKVDLNRAGEKCAQLQSLVSSQANQLQPEDKE